MSYGIIFWGNSSHSEEIFKIQEIIIRIIMNSNKNASCRQLFNLYNTTVLPAGQPQPQPFKYFALDAVGY